MRHTRKILLCLAVLLLLAAGAARAEEILHFTNGNAMPIRSHEVRGSMIHVDLGGDNLMAFPLSMVEKIEAAGKEIVLEAGLAGGSNVMSVGANRPVRGSVPSRYSDSKNKLPLQVAAEDPAVDVDEKMGIAVYRPYRNASAPNKRVIGATANRRIRGSSGMLGTTRMGSRHVITEDPSPGGKPELRGLDAKPSATTPPPPPEGDSSDSASGD